MRIFNLNLAYLPLCGLALLMAGSAHAAQGGLDSTTDTMPISVGGQQAIVLSKDKSNLTDPQPSIAMSGPFNEGGPSGTFIKRDGSTVIGSNNGTQPALSVTGGTVIGSSNGAAPALTVNGEVKIGSSGAGCGASNEGLMQYDGANHIMDYCNGTKWMPLTLVPDEVVIIASNNPNAFGYGSQSTITTPTNADGSSGVMITTNTRSPHELCALTAVQFGILIAEPTVAHNDVCDVGKNADGTWNMLTGTQWKGEEVNCAMQCYN